MLGDHFYEKTGKSCFEMKTSSDERNKNGLGQ